mmetsp:Transcript_46418/g.34094  ORF Transcript_46418/g.34094 Transcript_46418/m.34094 type:complete len:160 (+) Transcript_46418:570-1049(+)
MMFGAWANAQFMAGFSSHDEVAFKDADLLSGDAILNQRTVTSFGYDELIIERYESYIKGPHEKAKKSAHSIGAIFGISQGLTFWVFALLFWAGMKFIIRDPVKNGGEDVMMATLVLMFAAFAAGQSNQYGPDVGKAKKAAGKIFEYIDKPSKINAVDVQ